MMEFQVKFCHPSELRTRVLLLPNWRVISQMSIANEFFIAKSSILSGLWSLLFRAFQYKRPCSSSSSRQGLKRKENRCSQLYLFPILTILKVSSCVLKSPKLEQIYCKGQINSKWFLQANFSSKEWMNKFNFILVDLLLFVFWKKVKTPRRHFEINWPLASESTKKYGGHGFQRFSPQMQWLKSKKKNNESSLWFAC